MDKKQSLSKKCCLIAAALVILSFVWLFARALHWNADSAANNPSLIELAFGYGKAYLYRKPGFTALFVFEILAILAAVAVYLCHFNVIIGETGIGVFAIISSLISFVLMIMAFCSRPLLGLNFPAGITAEASLGYGSIMFAIFHLASIGLNVFALVYDTRFSKQ
ncbi:MAG: hypothetical protein MJ206_02000 [Bacilli bacterium]|nr:hypothetical protein [Bacilli bacterium]